MASDRRLYLDHVQRVHAPASAYIHPSMKKYRLAYELQLSLVKQILLDPDVYDA